MNESKQIGIKTFGILSILISIFFIVFKELPAIKNADYSSIFYFIVDLFWLVSGIGILNKLSWARVGLIIVAIIFLFDFIYNSPLLWKGIKDIELVALSITLIGLGFFCSMIYFLTRQKTKAQFTKNINV